MGGIGLVLVFATNIVTEIVHASAQCRLVSGLGQWDSHGTRRSEYAGYRYQGQALGTLHVKPF